MNKREDMRGELTGIIDALDRWEGDLGHLIVLGDVAERDF